MMRNKFFSAGIIKSTSFNLPVICIGNLSTGGTGKTPHTGYITELLLKSGYKIAILSRGYRRKTKDFLLVEPTHTFLEAGDEPCQYKRHFPGNNVIVAVDKKRRRGIEKILQLFPDVDAIILDDAYQHRRIKAGLNILLTDYYSPFFKDRMFPLGDLREPRSGKKRAHAIIVTKSPPVISPLTRRHTSIKMKLHSGQTLFFSKIIYGQGVGVYNNSLIAPKKTYSTIFMLTGIANPYPLREHLRSLCINMETYKFPDHHMFTTCDIKKLIKDFDSHLSTNKIIVTTEKDMIRLQSPKISALLSGYPIYYIPIEVKPDKNDKEKFDNYILDYVKKNKRNK